MKRYEAVATSLVLSRATGGSNESFSVLEIPSMLARLNQITGTRKVSKNERTGFQGESSTAVHSKRSTDRARRRVLTRNTPFAYLRKLLPKVHSEGRKWTRHKAVVASM